MLTFAHHFSQHPGDKPGRFQVVGPNPQNFFGLVSNTPWLLQGQHTPTLMAHAASIATLEHKDAPPETLCRQVLEAIHNVLAPFAGTHHTDDDFEAMWDFGGDAALVVESDRRITVAAVGNFRVVGLSHSGKLAPLLTEHTLAAREPNLTPEKRRNIGKIITANLANPGSPEDAITVAELTHLRCLLLGTPALLDFVDGAMAVHLLDSEPSAVVCTRMAALANSQRRKSDHNAPSAALALVQVEQHSNALA
jgi:hypothetical protein